MARLTPKQEKQLKELQALQEAPDTPAPSRSFNISMSYEQAEKAGLLDDLLSNGDDGDGDADGDADGDGDKPPQRGGFFGGS